KREMEAWSFPPLEEGLALFELPLELEPSGVVAREPERQARKQIVSLDKKAPTAGRDGNAINNVVQAHTAELERCYEESAARKPAGKLVLKWRIMPAGDVTGIEVLESTLKDPDAERCMRALVATWIFP